MAMQTYNSKKPWPQTNSALFDLSMTAEQLSAYVRLPYENLIKNQLQMT